MEERIIEFPHAYPVHEVLIKIAKKSKYIHKELSLDNLDIINEAKKELLKNNGFVDYFKNRMIKIDFSVYPYLDSKVFDSNHGIGSLKKIASSLFEDAQMLSRKNVKVIQVTCNLNFNFVLRYHPRYFVG